MLVIFGLDGLLHRKSLEGLIIVQFMFQGEFIGAHGGDLTLSLDGSHHVGQAVDFGEVFRRGSVFLLIFLLRIHRFCLFRVLLSLIKKLLLILSFLRFILHVRFCQVVL